MTITLTLSDDEESLVADLNFRELSRDLVRMAEQRQMAREVDRPHRAGHARMAVSWALNLAAGLVGDDVLDLAYGDDPAPNAPRAEHLKALAWRLMELERFHSPQLERWRAQSSLRSAITEILAIANEDEPRLFATLRGPHSKDFQNAHRLAPLQLRALEWAAFLKGHWSSADRSHDAVKSAFGVGTWDTIRKWRKPVIARLGRHAEHAINLAGQGTPMLPRCQSEREMLEHLRLDGARYQEENRKRYPIIEGGLGK